MTTLSYWSKLPSLLYFCLFMNRVLPVKRTIFLELKFFLRVPPVLARGIVLPLHSVHWSATSSTTVFFDAIFPPHNNVSTVL